MFDEALERRLSKLERESLLAKADMILRLCKPPHGLSSDRHYFFDHSKLYVYDRSKLSLVDEQRHRIVHGGSWAGEFRLDKDDLEYLFNTGLYFLDLVSATCSPTDPRNQPKDQKQKTKPTA